MRCFRYFDKDTRVWVHVPGCMGSAVNGPDQCTCSYPLSAKERDYRNELAQAKRSLKSMTKSRDQMLDKLLKQQTLK